MSDHKAESDLFALDVLPEPTVETRKPHILIVEHTNQGTEVTQGEPAYLFTIHYIVRHPDDCDPEECPITEHIEAVGLEDTLDLDSPSRSLRPEISPASRRWTCGRGGHPSAPRSPAPGSASGSWTGCACGRGGALRSRRRSAR
jgi:hypothetical protein